MANFHANFGTTEAMGATAADRPWLVRLKQRLLQVAESAARPNAGGSEETG
jgi:hypothetical protein